MTLKKRFAAVCCAGVIAVGLAGCGGSSDDGNKTAGGSGSGATGGGDYKISVILKTTSSEYWQYVMAGANAFGEETGYQVDVKGATSETAYDEQQNMIETDLNSSTYDAIVIAPLQSDQAKTLISGTEIPIIAVDTDIDAPEVKTFVGTGNEAAGKMGGEAAVEAAKAAGWTDIQAIEICGVQGDATNEARYAGYKSGVEAAGGTFLENETQYADAVADKAVNCMEAIMQNHPEGIAIIVCNNDDMAMAAARAAKDNDAYKNTIFVGFDGNSSACEAILNGEETLSVAQGAYEMGYQSCQAAVDILDGKTVDDPIEVETTIINKDNAQDRLDTLNGYLK